MANTSKPPVFLNTRQLCQRLKVPFGRVRQAWKLGELKPDAVDGKGLPLFAEKEIKKWTKFFAPWDYKPTKFVKDALSTSKYRYK